MVQIKYEMLLFFPDFSALFDIPVHRVSGSRILLIDQAQRFLPAEDWRVFLCGGQWWSRKTLWKRPHNTSAPESSDILQPYPAARSTPGLQIDVAALRGARWNSPTKSQRGEVWLLPQRKAPWIPTRVQISYRHWYLWKLLSNTILHDAPEVEVIIGLVWDTSPSLSNWFKLKRLWRLWIGRQRQFIKLEEEEEEEKSLGLGNCSVLTTRGEDKLIQIRTCSQKQN